MKKDNSERMNVDDVLRKYRSKIESQMNSFSESKAYSKFKEEGYKEYSSYEKWCYSLGNIIKVKPSKKDEEKLKKNIAQAHLSIEPWQALSLSVMSFLSVFFLGLILSVAITFIKGEGFGSFPLLLFFLITIFSIFLFYFLNAYPERLATRWRLKASSQMVPAILYLVVYMRHTPNLEKAIAFAAQHLQKPLALDFRRVFYSVEVGKFSTIKESLDNYLETWQDSSPEFIEAFHLIESSLFEPENSRRISTLEKALKVVLDGVYDKMLKFSHDVRSPLTNVYMLGVVLPTLGLALIPLASAMLGDMIRFIHVFVLFNLIIPFLVFYLTDQILLMRPGGYGETELLERNSFYADYKKKTHFRKAFLLALPFLIIGLIPLLFQYTPLPEALGIAKDFSFGSLGLGGNFESEMFFGFVQEGETVKGPFGIGALFLGMFFSLGAAMVFFVSYSSKTKKLIQERRKTKELEKEFNNSLFQLGTRLGNGVPPELVFGKVAQSTKGLRTSDFFRKVNYNIQQMGLSVDKAIFDRQRGAISFYPSDLIATTMRILIESSKKGLKIAAVSLMSISEYIKNISKINMRLKDLLAEVSSDMKSNMTFLAPLLSGIVVGLASLITSILGRLQLASTGDVGAAGMNVENILTIFDSTAMIPPYLLQISVGIYLIEIIFILTNTLVTVDSGEDKLQRTYKTALNLKKGIGLYIITAMIATIVLFILSVVVLSGL